MNHEELNVLVAKHYAENEAFRKEYEALMGEKDRALDVVKKNYTLNFRGYKIREEQVEAEFTQKVADLCKQTAEKVEAAKK